MHMLCPDFDLCAACEALPIPQHPDNHPMLKMKSNDTIIPTVYRLGQMFGSVPRGSFDRSSFVPPSRTPIASDDDSSNPDAVRGPALDISPKSDILVPDWVKSSHPSIQATSLSISDDKPLCPAPAPVGLGSNPPSPVFLPVTGLLSDQVPVPSLVADVASDVQEVSFASAATDKSPYTAIVLQAPNNPRVGTESPTESYEDCLDSSSEASINVPHNATLLFGGFETQLSHTSDLYLNELKRSPTPVLQAPNSPPRVGTESPTESYEDCLDSNSEASTNVPHSAPLFGGVETQLSHISGLCLNNETSLKRSPTPESAKIQSPSVHFARLSTLSLSGLFDAFRLNSDPAYSEKERRLSASFVQCTTVPDGSTFAPGVTFVKRWRFLNDGICEWPEATEVVSIGGASFAGGHLTSRVGAVKPGEYKEISTTELKVCLHSQGIFGFSDCFAIGTRSSWEIY